jgi:hypothetical protein
LIFTLVIPEIVRFFEGSLSLYVMIIVAELTLSQSSMLASVSSTFNICQSDATSHHRVQGRRQSSLMSCRVKMIDHAFKLINQPALMLIIDATAGAWFSCRYRDCGPPLQTFSQLERGARAVALL